MDQITNISVIVLVALLTLPLLTETFSHQPKVLAVMKYVVLAVYALGYLFETILFRTPTPDAQYNLELFWSYRDAMMVPGGLGRLINDIGVLGLIGGIKANVVTDVELLKEIILNILLFVPMGYLLPFTWPRLVRSSSTKERQHRVKYFPWRVVLIGFAISVLTELTQLCFHIGLCELDDVFNNTLGCVIGALCYMAVIKAGLIKDDRQASKQEG